MRPSAQLALGVLWATAARGESQKPISGDGDDDDKSVRGSPFTKEYAEHVGELLEKWHVPGVAIGIVDGDDIWTEVGHGQSSCPDRHGIMSRSSASSDTRAAQLRQGTNRTTIASQGPSFIKQSEREGID